MVSGLAPGKLAVTVIMGKSICGKGATGKKRKAKKPTAIIAMQINVLATGRKIKTLNKFTALAFPEHNGEGASSGRKINKPPVWCIKLKADYITAHRP